MTGKKDNTSAGRFAKAYHSILFKSELSFGARCVLIYALDNKAEWKFVAKNAAKKLGASKKVMTGILKELIKAGHLERSKVPTATNKFDYCYKFHLIPVVVDESERDLGSVVPNEDIGANIPNDKVPVVVSDTGTSIPKVQEPVSLTGANNHTPSNKTFSNHTLNQPETPSITEVKEYFSQKGICNQTEIEAWYNNLEQRQWCDKRGNKIGNWKAYAEKKIGDFTVEQAASLARQLNKLRSQQEGVEYFGYEKLIHELLVKVREERQLNSPVSLTDFVKERLEKADTLEYSTVKRLLLKRNEDA